MRRVELRPGLLQSGVSTDRAQGTRVSRRGLLRSALLASASLPLLDITRIATDFDVESRDGRIVFSVGGSPRWIIDPDRFDGDAWVSSSITPDRVSVQLERARYPGTQVPADLRCTINRTRSGWKARFKMPGIGFHSSVPFIDWLLARTLASGKVKIEPSISGSHDVTLALQGHGLATLNADWELTLAAPKIAELALHEVHTSANRVTLSLPESTSESLFASAPVRRTAISLLSGGDNVESSLRIGPVRGVLYGPPGTVLVETATVDETPTVAAFAEWGPDSIRPQFHIGEANAPDGLYLRRIATFIRLAATSGTPLLESVGMLGELVDGASWSRLAGLTAEVATASSGATLEIQRTGDVVDVRSTGLIVNRFVVPFPGVDVALFERRSQPGAGSGFTCGNNSSADLRFCGFFSSVHHVDLNDFNLKILRTADALAFIVRFRGIGLVKRFWSGWKLVAQPVERPPDGHAGTSSADTSAIEFDFGSQHLNEEAVLYEGGADCNRSPGGYPIMQRKRSTGVEAGPSRIVFDLAGASDVTEIPFSLEELFTWDPDRGAQAVRSQNGTGWLRMRTLPFALADDAAVSVQIGMHADPRRVPASIGAPLGANNAWGTALELPARLTVSPVALAGRGTFSKWTMSRLPRGSRGSQPPDAAMPELWSARQDAGPMRAVYSEDARANIWDQPPPGSDPRTSLDARDRHNLVWLSSGFGAPALLGSASVVPLAAAIARQKLKADLADDGGLFIPTSFRAEQLMLTSFGASFKFRGQWDTPAGVPHLGGGALVVRKWQHDGSLRRDVKVVVEYKGFLWPLGHPAVLVKETERHFITVTKARGETLEARLLQRFYIRVENFSHLFPAERQPFSGRDLPHKQLRMDQMSTPTLVDPDKCRPDGWTSGGWPAGYQYSVNRRYKNETMPQNEAGKDPGGEPRSVPINGYVFWPRVQGRPIGDAAGKCGNPVDFEFEFYEPEGARYRAPLLFIDNAVAHTPPAIEQLQKWYVNAVLRPYIDNPDRLALPSTAASAERPAPREGIAIVTNGQLRFAAPDKDGNTTFATETILLGVSTPLPVPSDAACPDAETRTLHLSFTPKMEGAQQPPFYPSIRRARIVPSSVAIISGNPHQPCCVEYHDTYVGAGFDPSRNAGEVYLRLADENLSLDFSKNTAAVGGVANPSAKVVAISRRYGPVGGQIILPNPQATYADMIASGAVACRMPPVPAPPSNLTATAGASPLNLAGLMGGAFGSVIRQVASAGSALRAITELTAQQLPGPSSSAPATAPTLPAAAGAPATPPAPPPKDPVASLISGGFDPAEYFGTAKLLGVVKLSDIVSAVQTVSGAQVPHLRQEQLFELPPAAVNALRAVADKANQTLGAAQASLQDYPEARRLSQLIGPALARLSEHLSDFSQAAANSGGQTPAMFNLIGIVASDARGLRDTIVGLESDPGQLLPPDFSAALDTAKTMYDSLWRLVANPDVPALLANWVAGQSTVWSAPPIQRLRSLADDAHHPQFQFIKTSLDAASNKVDELERVATDITRNTLETFARGLGDALYEYETAARRVYAWVDLASHTATPLCDKIAVFIGSILSAYRHDGSKITAAINDSQRDIRRGLSLLEPLPLTCHSGTKSEFHARLHDLDANLTAISAETVDVVASLTQPPFEINDCPSLIRLVQAGSQPIVDYRAKLLTLLSGYVGGPLAEWQNSLRQSLRLEGLLPGLRDELSKCAGEPAAAALVDWCDTAGAALRGRVTAVIDSVSVSLKSAGALTPLRTLADALSPAKITSLPPAVQVLAGDIAKWASALDRAPSALTVSGTPPEVQILLLADDGTKFENAEELLEEARATLVGVLDAKATAVAAPALSFLGSHLESAAIPPLAKIAETISVAAAAASEKIDKAVADRFVAQWLNKDLIHLLNNLTQALKDNLKSFAPPVSLDLLIGFYYVSLPATFSAAQQAVAQIGDSLKAGKIVDTERLRALIEERLLKPVNDLVDQMIPTHIQTSYHWETVVKAFPTGDSPIFLPKNDQNDPNARRKLAMTTTALVDLRNPSAAQVSVQGSLDKFDIQLLGSLPFLKISFDQLRFTSSSGSPLDLKVTVTGVEFLQNLSFIKALQSWLSPKSGPFFQLSKPGPGAEVGYRFHRPVISLAAMSLQNVGFSISGELPFDHRPARFQFKLSEPHNPFLLSVGIYGGGGYVGICAHADKIEYLEAAFEYGLVTAFQFGPATGQGRITAGIYFRISGAGAVLSGYFNASGAADIAGLITVSVAFRVELGYDGIQGNAFGRATFEIDFKIAFVSYGFQVNVAYEQAGGKDDHATSQSDSGAAGDRASALLGISAAHADSQDCARGQDTPPVTDTTSWLKGSAEWTAYWDAFDMTLPACEK